MSKTAKFAEPIRNWMDDWEREFDQNWDEAKLAEFTGQTISLTRPADEEKEREERTFIFIVVGWSCDRLSDPGDKRVVNKWSLLTDEGNQIAIYTDTIIAVAPA